MARLAFPPGVILGIEEVVQWRGETNKGIVILIIRMHIWTSGERYRGWVMIQWQVVNVEQSRWSACGQRSARDWNWSEPVISSTANIIITDNFWEKVHKLRLNCPLFILKIIIIIIIIITIPLIFIPIPLLSLYTVRTLSEDLINIGARGEYKIRCAFFKWKFSVYITTVWHKKNQKFLNYSLLTLGWAKLLSLSNLSNFRDSLEIAQQLVWQ